MRYVAVQSGIHAIETWMNSSIMGLNSYVQRKRMEPYNHAKLYQ